MNAFLRNQNHFSYRYQKQWLQNQLEPAAIFRFATSLFVVQSLHHSGSISLIKDVDYVHEHNRAIGPGNKVKTH